jgi:hypothetical protein
VPPTITCPADWLSQREAEVVASVGVAAFLRQEIPLSLDASSFPYASSVGEASAQPTRYRIAEQDLAAIPGQRQNPIVKRRMGESPVAGRRPPVQNPMAECHPRI